MTFIRPELTARFVQWREALQGAAVALLGLWIFLTLAGFVAFLGLALIALGLMLVWTGALRARFRAIREGPGVVEIVERRLTYYAPEVGFSLSLDDITRIEIGKPASGVIWIFHLSDGRVTRIPAAAAGAESILDILPSFPGAGLETAVNATRSPKREPELIWQKDH